ncbi:MAG: Peptidyl-prolyl cis-trans isomerase [Labilithrix sp.]|nr:Peptidyl-prolyl cis-trans isomerase [Labilithrix sp.]
MACSSTTREPFADPQKKDPESGFVVDSGAPPSPAPSGEVYGHSDTALYVVDTSTHAVREIGSFQGCTHVVDIALDESSTIYGSTGAELFLIENASGRCTRIASGSFPNSLSFVPAGALEPNKEVLVGYQGSAYVRIDPATGAVTKVGELGGNLESSGDLISVKDGKSFLTVKGPDCADCLVEFDPKTGALVKNWGPIGYANAYGLAFWGGELYAFTESGDVVLMKLVDDKLDATVLPVPNAPAGLAFRGAGSTTVAPPGNIK